MANDRLAEQIVTNIPASPLASNSPDFLTASLIKLAESYLQNHEVAYLGHAIKMLRPFAGRICKSNGIETYDEMIATCPEVKKGVNVPYLAATSNEIRFGAPRTFETTKDQESANNAAEFMNEMLEQMDMPFGLERNKLVYDYFRYGNGIAELEFGKGHGKLKDKIVVRQIRAADIKSVVFITDAFNRIIGYAPYGFPGVIAPLDSWLPADGFITYLFDAFERQRDREDALLSTQLLPKYKCLHLQWEPRSNDPRGDALLDAAFQPWWAKQQIIPILLYFIENFGIPRKKGVLGEKSDTIQLYDATGQPILVNGIPKTEKALPAFFNQLATWGAGGAMAMPYGFTGELEQADPLMIDGFLKSIDFFNREISSSITMQFLSSGQGQKSGGEKGVDSHRDVLSLMILKAKNDQSLAIREQICKPMMAANFGKATKKFAPKVDLGDADGFPVSLNEIGFLAQSIPDFFTKEMYPEIGRKVGFPYIDGGNKTVMKKSAIKDVNALSAILQTQIGCQQGAFTVEFED